VKQRIGVIATLLWIMAVVLGSAVNAAPTERGTAKIVDSVNAKPEPANDPHVCQFALEFFYGEADLSFSWEIDSWPPTGDGSEVLSGSATTDSEGFARQPVEGFYTLPDGHYKLFWDNLDTNGPPLKHKVFWVTCTSTPTPTPIASGSPVPPSLEPTPTPTPTIAPSDEPSATPTITPTPSASPPLVTPTPAATPPSTDTETSASDRGALGIGLLIGLFIGLLIGTLIVRRRLHEIRRR
jgi:hypothetical protein